MILGLASIQGFVLSALLIFNKNSKSVANKLIGLLVFCFSLMLVEEALEAFEFHRQMPKITGSGFVIELFLGPLTYVYACLLSGRRSVRKPLIQHLLFPLIANVVYLSYHLLVSVDEHFLFNEKMGWLMGVCMAMKIAFQVVYQLLSIIILNNFRKTVSSAETDTALLSLAQWVQRILTMVLVLIPMVFLLDGLQVTWPFDSDTLTSFIMIFSIYSVGYLALNYPLVYPRESGVPEVIRTKTRKYHRSALSKEMETQLTEKLRAYMEVAKPYLDPEFTAEQLARAIGTDRHQLSQVLNQSLEQGFYEFVNSYRVAALIKVIESPEGRAENILTMGLEAGFNSKATMNRAFKKVTKTTPLSYIKNHKFGSTDRLSR